MKNRLGLLLLLIGYGLLYPGLTEPLLSITGYVEKAELVQIGKDLIKQNPETPQMIISLVDVLVGNMEISRTVEAYQKTRSIIGTIDELNQSGHTLVAFLIMVFSVIIPAVKGLIMISGYFVSHQNTKRRLREFAATVSKWSMADVFVVGVFVAFLAANSVQKEGGLLSFQATPGNGFYCFVAYCLLSILSSQLINQSGKTSIPAE